MAATGKSPCLAPARDQRVRVSHDVQYHAMAKAPKIGSPLQDSRAGTWRPRQPPAGANRQPKHRRLRPLLSLLSFSFSLSLSLCRLGGLAGLLRACGGLPFGPIGGGSACGTPRWRGWPHSQNPAAVRQVQRPSHTFRAVVLCLLLPNPSALSDAALMPRGGAAVPMPTWLSSCSGSFANAAAMRTCCVRLLA
jgi:hypothetical protein